MKSSWYINPNKIEKIEVKKVYHNKGSDWAVLIHYNERNILGNKIVEDYGLYRNKQDALKAMKRIKKELKK